jgi:chemotaxis protein MotA
MFVLIGWAVVTACIAVGYIMEKGDFMILLQPAELVIIGGAAVGVFLVTTSPHITKNVIQGIKGLLANKHYGEAEYLDLLLVIGGIINFIRKKGVVALESHLDKPEESALFNPYKSFMANHHALNLTTDVLRMVVSSRLEAHQMDGLMEMEIDGFHEEQTLAAGTLNNISDSLPGLGIVAAVLGVVVTMQKISEPPEVLGHSIGAALVGTFLGILGAYGFIGPLAKKLQWLADQEKEYLIVLKSMIVAFVAGMQPMICVEFGRMLIPEGSRPSFDKTEKTIQQAKKAE